MTHQITLAPGGFVFSANDDETLLEAALAADIVVPHGCKNGACGACHATLQAGEVDRGAYQSFALSDSDITQGGLLLCTARAKTDLVIDQPQARKGGLPQAQELSVRVEKLERAAPDVIVLTLRLPSTATFDFLAGQYIDILLPDGKTRSYSLANAPEQKGFLELHIREVKGGRFTGQVFGSLKVKDFLRIVGPEGAFYLRTDTQKPAILLASGTGFAPIKAIVEHALAKNLQRPLHIYWGARKRIDLYLNDLPEGWAQRFDFIDYTPVLSEVDADWQGRSGLVHQAVLADHPDLSGFEVYACGNPLMIEAAKKDFGQAGLPDAAFFSDAFTFAPQ
ncbi:MAG: CDP-6-deoxy-delta-3,4-glucoseen reductase [Zoogloeaceae bacterium]|jgi:CDP-4-dehydro-6-deoxyglucose reductase|nr:CDP-6-deoxy-delta-3,4-glucoseen reductase [Zoogloeaceae bacterium]